MRVSVISQIRNEERYLSLEEIWLELWLPEPNAHFPVISYYAILNCGGVKLQISNI